MSVLEKLTEGIVNRDLQKEGAALLAKWENTGLLEGMKDERSKDAMARLLENQANVLLRVSSTLQHGDGQFCAAVSFLHVLCVFAGLFSNDLVSGESMWFPFFLLCCLVVVFSPVSQ